MFSRLFPIVIYIGSLVFWVAAMIVMPDDTPGYIKLFALSFYWLGIAIMSSLSERG
jgi:hypothetical protein